MKFPEELKYTKDHEWIRLEGNVAVIGITDYAQGELGEIVFVDVPTEGESLSKEVVFGTIEAVKTVSDLYLPVTGKVLEINADLEEHPELVNSDPYGKGWIIKLEVKDLAEHEALLSAEAYKKLLGK